MSEVVSHDTSVCYESHGISFALQLTYNALEKVVRHGPKDFTPATCVEVQDGVARFWFQPGHSPFLGSHMVSEQAGEKFIFLFVSTIFLRNSSFQINNRSSKENSCLYIHRNEKKIVSLLRIKYQYFHSQYYHYFKCSWFANNHIKHLLY